VNLILPRRIREGQAIVRPSRCDPRTLHRQRGLINPYIFGGGGTLRTNLVSFWEFEEASGASSYVDAVAGANNLIPSGTITQVAGQVGNAAQAASGSFLKNTAPSGLSFASSAFTVAAWFNSTNFDNGIVCKYDIGAGQREWALLMEVGIGKFTVSVDGSDPGRTTVTTVSATPAINVWNLMIAWRSLTDDKLYLQLNNGTPDSVAFSHTNTIFTGAAALTVASLTTSSIYDNGLTADQTGIWSRELSSGERSAIWNGGAGLAYSAM
jgi:hypothetical protein